MYGIIKFLRKIGENQGFGAWQRILRLGPKHRYDEFQQNKNLLFCERAY